MKAVLAGLLLVICAACGGDDGGSQQFAVYHLETAVGGPGDEGELWCGPPRSVCPGIVRQPPIHVARYAVVTDPTLSGEHIDRAKTRRSTDPADGAPVVLVELTADGTRAFARLTKEVARMGGRDQGWHHIAIVIGDEIVAFPEIDFDRYPDGREAARRIRIAAANDADALDLVGRLRAG